MSELQLLLLPPENQGGPPGWLPRLWMPLLPSKLAQQPPPGAHPLKLLGSKPKSQVHRLAGKTLSKHLFPSCKEALGTQLDWILP